MQKKHRSSSKMMCPSNIIGSDKDTLAAAMQKFQQIQREVDESSFFVGNKELFQLKGEEIVKHDLYHLIKLTAKLADFYDKRDHFVDANLSEVESEVVPDLLIYALQLANALELDLYEMYEARLHYVINKFYGR